MLLGFKKLGESESVHGRVLPLLFKALAGNVRESGRIRRAKLGFAVVAQGGKAGKGGFDPCPLCLALFALLGFLGGLCLFVGFVAFLLALTLALKEHTEKRLVPGHKLSFKPMGIVLLLLGAFGIFYGASFLIGHQPLPNGSGTCRAICGFILLASESFGETVAKWFAFGLWSSIGLFLCFLGYIVKGVQAT